MTLRACDRRLLKADQPLRGLRAAVPALMTLRACDRWFPRADQPRRGLPACESIRPRWAPAAHRRPRSTPASRELVAHLQRPTSPRSWRRARIAGATRPPASDEPPAARTHARQQPARGARVQTHRPSHRPPLPARPDSQRSAHPRSRPLGRPDLPPPPGTSNRPKPAQRPCQPRHQPRALLALMPEYEAGVVGNANQVRWRPKRHVAARANGV